MPLKGAKKGAAGASKPRKFDGPVQTFRGQDALDLLHSASKGGPTSALEDMMQPLHDLMDESMHPPTDFQDYENMMPGEAWHPLF